MSQRPLIVQFGAGNIGRSLVAQLFSHAGWDVVFLDIDAAVIDALNQRGTYQITVKDDILPGQPERIDVAHVSGINLRDRARAVAVLKQADLVGTSVGAANLQSACALLAEALPGRSSPLSVLLCENLHDAAALCRSYLAAALPDGYSGPNQVGFVEAAISKMVPSTPEDVRKVDPLAVWAEAYNTLYLDADAYIGNPPAIFGVAWRTRFPAYVDRKLLLHNFGHAAAAYHGFLAGKKFIWECMDDGRLRTEIAGCMMETARGLAVRHRDVFTFDENRAWADDLLRRFANRALADPVFRVGRDLKRKLAPGDRCVGALRLLRETGVEACHTIRALAAGLLFAPCDEQGNAFPGDSEIVALASKHGPEAVLTRICGMDPNADADSIAAVSREYRRLTASGRS